jgi:hypothetical protein
MSLTWRHADFAARVGEQVTLRTADDPGHDVSATLDACSAPVRRGDFISYSVIFVAGPEAPREQALFLIEAAGREPEPIFLVPLRAVADHLEFQAVFNQSVDIGSCP